MRRRNATCIAYTRSDSVRERKQSTAHTDRVAGRKITLTCLEIWKNVGGKEVPKSLSTGVLCAGGEDWREMQRKYFYNSNEIMCHRWQASIEIHAHERTRARVTEWTNEMSRNTLALFSISFSSLIVREWRAPGDRHHKQECRAINYTKLN